MWRVSRPVIDPLETYDLCISRVKNADLKRNLEAIRQDIESASIEYIDKAETNSLYQIGQTQDVRDVPAMELIKTYDNRMAKSNCPGRAIYDKIKLLPNYDCCPFCDHRNISTLDHILPKSCYTLLTVNPLNLVACCSDCNKAKRDKKPSSEEDSILHPYFDDVENQQWLYADIIEENTAAIIFRVAPIEHWPNALNARLINQFDYLRLGQLYASQAARLIADIQYNMCRLYKSGGANAVREELTYQWQSRQNHKLNSWQTAAYEALKNSDWFCENGFLLT